MAADTEALKPGTPVQVVNLVGDRGASLNDTFGTVLALQDDGVIVHLASLDREGLFQAQNLKVASEIIAKRVSLAFALIKAGRLFDASKAVRGLPGAHEIGTELDRLLSDGSHSEIVHQRLEIADVSGKGKGYRAAKDVKKGDVLLFDTVFCCAEKGDGYLQKMVKQAHPKSQSAFFNDTVLSLTSSSGFEGALGAQAKGIFKLPAILANNVFECSRDPAYLALYPAASRLNHSCCANASVDGSRTQAVVRALRDIQAGEEVCVSYIPLSWNLKQRREYLVDKGFVCTCERCEAEACEDPQFIVACKCGQHHFNCADTAAQEQICPNCKATHNRDQFLSILGEIEEANTMMRTSASKSFSPQDLLEKMTSLAESEYVLPLHAQYLQLLNNLANLYFIIAEKSKGEERAALFTKFLEKKEQRMAGYQLVSGRWTNFVDLNAFHSMHRVLTAEFTNPGSKAIWQERLREACMLQFGQSEPPATLIAYLRKSEGG